MKKFLLSLILIFGLFVAQAATPSTGHSKTSNTKHTKKKRSKAHKPKKSYMAGIASFYGGSDGFDGRPMANGRIFHAQNPNLSAHPTLPLGTKLRVTDPLTNKSIYVEVTDRMPKQHRVIDLSKMGAKELGIHNRGTAYVELTVISNQEYQLKKNTMEIEANNEQNS